MCSETDMHKKRPLPFKVEKICLLPAVMFVESFFFTFFAALIYIYTGIWLWFY